MGGRRGGSLLFTVSVLFVQHEREDGGGLGRINPASLWPRRIPAAQFLEIIASTKTASKESEQSDSPSGGFSGWHLKHHFQTDSAGAERISAWGGLSREGSLNTPPVSLLPSSQSECFALITTLQCRKTTGKIATRLRQECRKMSAGGEITLESDASQKLEKKKKRGSETR